MDVFVGAEYLIANALIALKKKGINKISVSLLHSFGIEVQQLCIEKSIDAVFLLSKDSVSAAVYNFSDYFTFEEDKGESAICLNSSAKIEDLEKRFIGYLPIALLKVIMQSAQALGAA